MAMHLDFSAVLERWPSFLDGLVLTVELAIIATIAGFVCGTVCAIALRSETPARPLCSAYVEVIRNTPLLVQVFLLYFGLATLGWRLSAFTVAAAAMIINVTAYTAEIMRAGLDSIPKGQVEAGECLALSTPQIYWHVLLPPAMERVYPALASQFVLLMLASSVVSQISVEEMTAVANHVQSDIFRPFEAYVLIAGLYICLALAMKAAFWGLGLAIFPRRRRLGTPL